jgi:hypothetical protein
MKTMHKKEFAWSLWLPVIAAFILVTTVWFFTIKLASENPTEVIKVGPHDQSTP